MSRRERPSRRVGRWLAAGTVLALLAGCTIGTRVDATSGSGLQPGRSLTDAGTALAGATDWSARPRYHVVAEVDPITGTVAGAWSATLPVLAEDDEIDLFFLPLLAAFADDASVEDVTVGGQPVEADVSAREAMITVPLEPAGRTSVDLAMTFSYEVEEVDLAPTPSGDSDNPTEPDDGAGLGVLNLHDEGLTLGSWFPTHAYAAASASSVRRIGNSPAAQFSVELSVPLAYDVITSGVRTGSYVEQGRQVVLEQAYGVRDLPVLVRRDLTTVSRQVGATTIRVHAPSRDEEDADDVLEVASQSLEALGAAFGGYPWLELDIASVPMGGGAGGLAWPGMVWIEPRLLSSGVGGGADERRWAVAHEIGHQWWSAQVQSDPHVEPVLDEALAQYSACVVHRAVWGDEGDDACQEWITGVYVAMRDSGFSDGVVNRLSFSSPEQQSGLTYGKAPQVLLELSAEYGDQEVMRALAAFAHEQAFGIAGDAALAEYLGNALDDPAEVAEIWHRWMLEINADEDLDYAGG